MCGLLAGTGKIKSDVIQTLGCLNASRGEDSAGLAWIEDGKLWFQKTVGHPIASFTMHLTDGVQRCGKSSVVIGHTRAATQGAVTDQNAHPFFDDQIAWAHNGVITNDDDFGKFAVDSQSLIFGIKEKNFSKYVGSIALVWIEEGKLHCFRKGNPLYRGRLEGGLYMASEENFLEAVGCTHIKEISEGHHYVFSPEGKIESAKSIPVNRLSVVGYNTTDLTAYSRSKWAGYGYSESYWKDDKENTSEWRKTANGYYVRQNELDPIESAEKIKELEILETKTEPKEEPKRGDRGLVHAKEILEQLEADEFSGYGYSNLPICACGVYSCLWGQDYCRQCGIAHGLIDEYR